MKNSNICESEHPLVTPEFIGLDEEKISVIQYWSEIIGLLRSMNSCVVSIENKQAIINQLKKEIELLDIELNNISAVPVENEDGSYDMDQPTGVDLRNPEPQVKTNQMTKESLQKLAGNWVPKRLTK